MQLHGLRTHRIHSIFCSSLQLVSSFGAALESLGMATPTFDHILLRMDAVCRVLTTLVDSPHYAEYVARHAATLRKLFNSAELFREIKGDDAKAAQLVDRIKGMSLPGDVEADLVERMLELMQPSRHRNYRGFQNWVHVYLYISECKWEHLMSETTKKSVKLFELVSFFILLGLYTPSEPTFQMLTAIYICCTHEEEEVDSMDAAARKVELIYVKNAFRAQVKNVDEPSVFVAVLPPDPETFIESYPSLSADLGTDPPGKLPFAANRLLMVAGMIRMRGEPKQGMCGAMSSPGTLQNCMMQQIQQSMHQMRLAIANNLERRESNNDIGIEYFRPARTRAILDRESPFPKLDKRKGRPAIPDKASQPTTKLPVGDGIAVMAEPPAAPVEAPSKKRKKKRKHNKMEGFADAGGVPIAEQPVHNTMGKKKKKKKLGKPRHDGDGKIGAPDATALASSMFQSLFSRDVGRKKIKCDAIAAHEPAAKPGTGKKTSKAVMQRPAAAPAAIM